MAIKLFTIILVYLIHLRQTLPQGHDDAKNKAFLHYIEDAEILEKETLKNLNDNGIKSNEKRIVRGIKIVDVELPDSLHNFTIKVPPHCVNEDLCDDYPDYPKIEILKIVKKYYKYIQKYFIKEMPSQLIDTRNNDGKNYLCQFTEEQIAPEIGKKEENWMLILNPMQKIQVINIVKCNSHNSDSCSAGTDNEGIVAVDENYKSFCQELPMKKSMLYLDTENKVISLGDFTVPVCCTCMTQEIEVEK